MEIAQINFGILRDFVFVWQNIPAYPGIYLLDIIVLIDVFLLVVPTRYSSYFK
jgi:hypothetical protein